MTEPASANARPALDPAGVARGAVIALVIAIPAGIALRVVGPESGSQGLLFLVVLIGFAIGGAVAASTNPDRYLTQASAASLVAVVVFLIVGLVDRAVSGRSVNVVSLAFTALLAVSSGILGAELGERRRLRAAAASDDGEHEPDE